MNKILRGFLAVLCALAMCATAMTPAEAAKKKFKQAETCAWGMPPEWGGKPMLALEVAAGHWHGEDGDTSRCMDQFTTRFRPSLKGGFTARVQWYRGKKVVKSKRRHLPNTAAKLHAGNFGFYNKQLKLGRDGKWRVRGKVITAKVKFSKRGYRTKTVRVVWFGTPAE